AKADGAMRHELADAAETNDAERGRQLNVDMLPLDQLVATSDFLTVHLPKNKETRGLINRDLLLKAKPELRIINVARGGIVVESDLAEVLRDGIIAGAALDVFEQEPVTDSVLFTLPNVVVTPHLGASTREAQDKAGEVIADMVQLALAGDFVPFAVNVNASEANETLKPFIWRAQRVWHSHGSSSRGAHRSDRRSPQRRAAGQIHVDRAQR
ncbi:MAG: hypothetical protein EBX51_05390, partial [Acidimicrobiia bacterium]|nr:hypothetical protein [Acidimicrobiia bacterium]